MIGRIVDHAHEMLMEPVEKKVLVVEDTALELDLRVSRTPEESGATTLPLQMCP